MYSLLKTMNKLEQITANARKQGKSDDQVKQLIKLYLTESKKKINPDMID